MTRLLWQDILLTPGNEEYVWELLHENSKLGRYDYSLSEEEVRNWMEQLHESLPFEGYQVVNLPEALSKLHVTLEEAITSRVSVRNFTPRRLTLENVATLLRYAYGITRDNNDTNYTRPFRVVPSGGGLYPLELFFHSAWIEGKPAGLYHYNPTKNHLRLLFEGDATHKIAESMVNPNLVCSASLVVFITGIFERAVFKYRDRGYRFTLLEAGHVAQNINLVSNGLGFGCVNIGGFFDREIDDFLGLDGVTHSTLYMIAIGGKGQDPLNLNRGKEH